MEEIAKCKCEWICTRQKRKVMYVVMIVVPCFLSLFPSNEDFFLPYMRWQM